MLIAICKITIRKGGLEKVMPAVEENARFGMEQPGLVEGFLLQSIDNENEILIYSRWRSREDYMEAKKRFKKDSLSTKLMFKLFPYVAKHETKEYEILNLNSY